ncbi:hypothetical protein VTJ83DRAFT_6433 [Remersonia thermophila]|uniref:tRNA(Ile)-lysidine synthetase n=1 Tax=Remersonia thermophila TaxID=72144 RepID=A0ABR4D4S1_9PEZI
MTFLPPVLHCSARPISVAEFGEVVQATCIHRFPRYRGYEPRKIGLAISGGVDSMALAFLCSKLKKSKDFKVADHPIGRPVAFVVDHGLREGSREEAAKVRKILVSQLKLSSEVLAINWKQILGRDANPAHLPNIETVARYHRYRRIASGCTFYRIMSLFTAHHEDDQYETILMRLLSGHGYRGLQGMRRVTDIPECYDINGAYQSGFVDDQRREVPFYRLGPVREEAKELRRELYRGVDPAEIAEEICSGLHADFANAYLDDYSGIAGGRKHAPEVTPLEIEEGGITVYRPLLGFSKDRLIATCVENNIPWFEDHTNQDATLTLRNAVRYMCKHRALPAALQKPAVLRMAERCRERVASLEAEAKRWLQRAHVHEFGANAGTLVVTMPDLSLPTVPTLSAASPARRQKRLAHYRLVAAQFLRHIMAPVSPERELSQPAQLGHLISMLFPSLRAPDDATVEPKPYVICGVLFTPLVREGGPPSERPRWLLSRAPHVSNVPRPSCNMTPPYFKARVKRHASRFKTSGWSRFQLYDGRYWVRLLHRFPVDIRIAPFEPEHHKAFRDALADDDARRRFAAALRRHAPGKVRYTLPAIYATQDVARLLRGEDWWPPELSLPGGNDAAAAGPKHPSAPALAVANASAIAPPSRGSHRPSPLNSTAADEPPPEAFLGGQYQELWEARMKWETALVESGEKPMLLALPTLGIGVPNLEYWLRWEVRYKKVDDELLRLGRIGGFYVPRDEARTAVRRRYWKERRSRGETRRGLKERVLARRTRYQGRERSHG